MKSATALANVFIGTFVRDHERTDRLGLGFLDDQHCDSLLTAM